ncbi:MAG TPA: flavodoxin family protein [Candidatus Dorea intestinavium]|nr:flavodoxin family protein [Candidatus Dorea intestinavium]
MINYLVLYESLSGNTKKVATEIFSSLPGNSKDIIDLSECTSLPEARVYFIGFGIYYGSCHLEINSLLSSISKKAIALFATCSMGNSDEYKKHIAQTVSAWIEDDNVYLGAFICQGKIPMSLRCKCEHFCSSMGKGSSRALLKAFDSALTHPDRKDLEDASSFVKKCLEITKNSQVS